MMDYEVHEPQGTVRLRSMEGRDRRVNGRDGARPAISSISRRAQQSALDSHKSGVRVRQRRSATLIPPVKWLRPRAAFGLKDT